jgi:hypothetical protein
MNLDELDVVQLRLYRAGVPQFELFAEDPGLWELQVTRELFNIASRIMYVRRSSRIPEATRRRRRDDPVEHQRFLFRLRAERRLWQDDYARRVSGAAVALCSLDSCRRIPAIMHRVLSLLATRGFDRPLYSRTLFHCVADGCLANIVGVASFFNHVRQSHMHF